MIVIVGSYVAFYLPNSIVDESISNILYFKVSGASSGLFYLIFCYQMSKVND